MTDPGDALVRFGAFELDLRTGELRRSGVRIHLADQPFQVLRTLLDRPGDLVTREELRQRLWAAETFVDFERGLNAAVRRLRDALGDSADVPRFVETLPRRGYRFIAPVSRQPEAQKAGPLVPGIAYDAIPAPDITAARRPTRTRRPMLIAGMAVGVAAVLWDAPGNRPPSWRDIGGGGTPVPPRDFGPMLVHTGRPLATRSSAISQPDRRRRGRPHAALVLAAFGIEP